MSQYLDLAEQSTRIENFRVIVRNMINEFHTHGQARFAVSFALDLERTLDLWDRRIACEKTRRDMVSSYRQGELTV